ncbi:hypothetical protein BT96DRAFT_1008470 [Gymnopus androsaceus JB14]|uniref:Hydroxymethylglutaryl-CoA reductase (NADPH) n=1 Tax=Gymnopus androsaceus JB14 TaxID=1447944 RepID=A0A6A4GEP7_9AGAR|nr:hypothetical protein BT96DRAFT_1008470 [Gymnopus androsaceus JB14]
MLAGRMSRSRLVVLAPLKIDGHIFPTPMATAEGILVASTSRGCKAPKAGGGVTTVLIQDTMTRSPAIDFPNVLKAERCKAWIDSVEGYGVIKEAFESTSRFARLRSLKCAMAGRMFFASEHCVEDYGGGLGEPEHEEESGGGDPAQNVESSYCMKGNPQPIKPTD